MPAAAAAPMQGTYIPQYTAVPASAITVEVRTKSSCLLSSGYSLYQLHIAAYPWIFSETSVSVAYLLPQRELQVVSLGNIRIRLWFCGIHVETLALILLNS